MFKKILTFAIFCFVHYGVGFAQALANPQEDKQVRPVEKVRENVRKLGVGEAARIEVKLINGKKLKGYIREAGEDSFVLVDDKTGSPETVGYSQIKQIKGKNRLTAAKVGLTIVKGVAIVAAVAAAATLFLYIIASQTR